MKIWVDADACPKVIKEILYRVAKRTKIQMTFVANQHLYLPSMPNLKMLKVSDGPDIADDKIVECCTVGDLIVTADIPLADRVIKKGALAIDPRGREYTPDNIAQILGMRNFMTELRGSGVDTGGPSSFDPKNQQKFANALDRLIAKQR